mmetsp:Transcript_12646/g.37887  ORF Transcript_12646/g.37887 Transcript_12646/m.37887 type:complete len:202 (+) Transcript_12646:1357-1962(+)
MRGGKHSAWHWRQKKQRDQLPIKDGLQLVGPESRRMRMSSSPPTCHGTRRGGAARGTHSSLDLRGRKCDGRGTAAGPAKRGTATAKPHPRSHCDTAVCSTTPQCDTAVCGTTFHYAAVQQCVVRHFTFALQIVAHHELGRVTGNRDSSRQQRYRLSRSGNALRYRLQHFRICRFALQLQVTAFSARVTGGLQGLQGLQHDS